MKTCSYLLILKKKSKIRAVIQLRVLNQGMNRNIQSLILIPFHLNPLVH